MSAHSILTLPIELQLHVLDFLDGDDLSSASHTCRQWQAITETLYKPKCLARWPAIKHLATAEKTDEEWKKSYYAEHDLEKKWKAHHVASILIYTSSQIIHILPHRIHMNALRKDGFLLHFSKQGNISTDELLNSKRCTEFAANENIYPDGKKTYFEYLIKMNMVDHTSFSYRSRNFGEITNLPLIQETYRFQATTHFEKSFFFSNQANQCIQPTGIVREVLSENELGAIFLGKTAPSIPATHQKWVIAFFHLSQDGSFYAYGKNDRFGPLEDLDGTKLFSLMTKAEVFNASLAGNLLTCYHSDNTLRLYDILAKPDTNNDLKEYSKINLETDSKERLHTLLNDGTFVLTGFASGKVKVFSTPALDLKSEIRLSSQLTCLASDGKKWAAGTNQNKIEIFNNTLGERLNTIQLNSPPTALAFDNYIDNILYVATETRFVKYTFEDAKDTKMDSAELPAEKRRRIAKKGTGG